MENTPDATKVIHVNFFPSEVDDTYFPQLDVVGDIAGNVQEINKCNFKQEHWDFDYYMQD